MRSPKLRVEKIVKWREILGVSYRDLYFLTNDEKKNKMFSIMTLEHKNLDRDTKQLLISDLSNSILIDDYSDYKFSEDEDEDEEEEEEDDVLF
jgi:hypothetical protein